MVEIGIGAFVIGFFIGITIGLRLRYKEAYYKGYLDVCHHCENGGD